MRQMSILILVSVLVHASVVRPAHSSQPSHGEFRLEFSSQARLGESNKLIASCWVWASCEHCSLSISIPMIGNEPARVVYGWDGRVESGDTARMSVVVPALPRGAYQFISSCRLDNCSIARARGGGSTLTAWVTTDGIVTAPFGYENDMLDTILHHLEIEKLGNSSPIEIRDRNPQLYRIMYYDLSIPPDSTYDPRVDPSVVPIPTQELNSTPPERHTRTGPLPSVIKRGASSTDQKADSGNYATARRAEEIRQIREIYGEPPPDTTKRPPEQTLLKIQSDSLFPMPRQR